MKNSVIKNIIHSFWKSYQKFGSNRKKVLLTSAITLLIQGAGLFETYLLAGITDTLYEGKQKDFFTYICLAAVMGLTAIFLQKFVSVTDMRTKQAAVIILKKKVMDILWSRDENVMQFSAGEQHSIIQEDSEKLVLYVYQVISYLFSIAVIMYISITLFYISAKWAAVFTVIQLLIGILQKSGAERIKEKSRECLNSQNEFEQYLNEDISRIHAIRFENLKTDVIMFLGKELEKLISRQLERNELSVRITLISRSLMYIGKMVLFFGMGKEVLDHRVSMAQFIIFYSYMSMFTSNFMYVIQMITSLQPMLINVNRLLAILDMEQKIVQSEQLNYEQIEWKHVTKMFGQKELFSDVDLEMDMKMSHAIIGANGSGKSTFMKILLGEEKVSSGEILIDGRTIKEFKLERFSDIHYFATNPCVLSGLSVKENMLLGNKNKNITAEKLRNICEDFLFWNDIQEMQNGWSTIVEKDVSLSSGQMKKMQLIRAALCDGVMVILDEPMANLDEEFRNLFDGIFQKYFSMKKIFIVEHGRNRVLYVDRVLTIQNHNISY